jgi:hypothetical protein
VRREEYVRPPVVAAEAPSATAARWRYRVTATVLLLLALAFFTWLFLVLSGVTGGENPGISGALGAQPGSGIVSTARVPHG